MHPRLPLILPTLALLPYATTTIAQPLQLAPVTIQGNYNNALGTTDAASKATPRSLSASAVTHAR